MEIDITLIRPYLVIASALLVLSAMDGFRKLFPSLMDCLLKGKGNIDLEYHPSIKITRDLVFLILMPAFILILFLIGSSPLLISAYILLRMLLNLLCRSLIQRDRTFAAGCHVPMNFFILAMAAFAITGTFTHLISPDSDAVKYLLLWEFAAFYLVCLIREFQVFYRSQGFFGAFLYLCALEFLPTGLLAAGFYFL